MVKTGDFHSRKLLGRRSQQLLKKFFQECSNANTANPVSLLFSLLSGTTGHDIIFPQLLVQVHLGENGENNKEVKALQDGANVFIFPCIKNSGSCWPTP